MYKKEIDCIAHGLTYILNEPNRQTGHFTLPLSFFPIIIISLCFHNQKKLMFPMKFIYAHTCEKYNITKNKEIHKKNKIWKNV